MTPTQKDIHSRIRVQMDRLRANVKALQSTDQCGNPDMEVTKLISRLMIEGSSKSKEDVCAKLDDQARQIVTRDQIIDELRLQLRITQDELHSEAEHPLGPDYRPSMPWTSQIVQDEIDESDDPDGEALRYSRFADEAYEAFGRDY